MDALLLAAGLGTRLKPLTSVLPKCLMPIQGRPLLGLWLEMLKQGGIDRIFINLHYLAPLVRDYVNSGPYADIVTFLDEPELLGTAGTLGHFRNFYGSEDLLMAHADNLTLFDIHAFRTAFEARPEDCHLTMMTFETDDPQSCGIVSLDSYNRVINFTEKPEQDVGRLANGAVYIMNLKAVFDLMDQGSSITDFSTEILPHFIGRMNCFHNSFYHRDIGNVTALGDAQKEIACLQQAQELISSVATYWQQNDERQSLLADFQACLATVALDPEAIRALVKT